MLQMKHSPDQAYTSTHIQSLRLQLDHHSTSSHPLLDGTYTLARPQKYPMILQHLLPLQIPRSALLSLPSGCLMDPMKLHQSL